MEGYAERSATQLSGGQQQRVALARALVIKPDVLLLDEPLSNLDAKLRLEMREEIRRLHDETGLTTIYVTHDQAEAMTMADQIAVMRDGKLEQVGTPDEIYSSPQSLYVAGFVGSPSMNLIPAHYDADAHTLAGDGFSLPAAPIMESLAVDSSTPADFSLGIRPEHIALRFEPAPEAIAGRVYAVEPMGNETLVYVEVGHSTVVARADAALRAGVNTPCWLSFRQDRLFLFDLDTERRVVPKP